MIKEIPVKKGQKFIVSIFGANRSKEIWGEDAEIWKPERWLGKSTSQQPVDDSKDYPETYDRKITKVTLPGAYAGM